MKSEKEVREEWRDKRAFYKVNTSGNQSFQEGYIFALEWVLSMKDDDDSGE